jgi:transcription initiation factor TFIIH subunit 2
MSFERLIRFVDESGTTRYGNLVREVSLKDIEKSEVQVVEGDLETGFTKSSKKTTVHKVMSTTSSHLKRLTIL